MKQHITIKLKQASTPKKHWKASLFDKTTVNGKLEENVDRLLADYQLPVWVTAEYEPQELEFNLQEKEIGLDRTYRLILKEERVIPNQLLQQLKALDQVEFVRTSTVNKVELPKISVVKQQTHHRPKEARTLLAVEKAHQLFSKGNENIKIAVLDTGVNLNHPELKHALVPGFDFVNVIDGATDFFGDAKEQDDDPEDELVGHGTHVAGIIAGIGKAMPIGIAPNCKIIPVRVLGTIKQNGIYVGAGFVDQINAGIKWAVDQGADIINMSLGIQHEGGGLPHEDAIRYAQKKGVTVVAASGNDGQAKLYYPGALPHVIAVGASKDQTTIAPFSTFGKVTVCAPGEQIYSASINKKYAFASGTSQAAPFVSGLIALLKSYSLKQGKQLGDNQIKYLLKHTSDKPSLHIKDKHWGYGHINLLDALQLLHYKLN